MTEHSPPTAARSVLLWLQSPAVRALAALALVLLVGVVFNADGAFFKAGMHRDALRQMSVYGILACGMTLVITTGGIDLAVGSVLALSSVCCAMMAIHWGWSPWAVIPLSIAVGAACGCVSGLMTAWLRVQPFIATLAMMVFARGLAKHVSGGMKVSTAAPQPDGSYLYLDVPPLFRAIDARLLGGNVSTVTLVFLACAAVAWVVLSWRRLGRELYAIGGNEEAARMSGVPVVRSTIWAYLLSGALAGVAGVCQASQEQQGDPEAGAGYELTAIAMVVIGGTSLMGGRGGMGLTLLGVLTIGYLDKILSINAIPSAMRLMLTGVIIIAAVLTQKRGRY
ncbi:Ribose transport system permease protein RbsC [Posidoniimonas polymericola]|uniref:Ribose transport system permease protein RbsC n=1 Tax=Posidoniimonas polymericola TaxID=2528002 RepID=A0A5C5YTL1_9BACT|nr:ABC transporter permease [Posidoniimonas polymericola]TWT78344.1 Ribose transport system permease protein RbsC [Posidoniimonas polymericola]